MPLSALFVLNALKQNRRMALDEISTETHIPESKLRATLERLTEGGLTEAIGNSRGRVYVLSAKMYGDPVKYVRQTDIEQIRYKELIMKLAEKKQSITRSDVIELLHVNPPQAYRLLQKLVKDQQLIPEGTTSATKYKIHR